MNRLLTGLKILEKYEPDFDSSFECGIMYCCRIPPKKMTKEDTKTLDEVEWSWDNTLECWYHF